MLALQSSKRYNRGLKDRATLFTASLRKMWEEASSAEAVVRRTEMPHAEVPQTPKTRGGHVAHLRKAVLKKNPLGWQISSSADVLSSLLKGSRHTHYRAVSTPGVPMLVSLTERRPGNVVLRGRQKKLEVHLFLQAGALFCLTSLICSENPS